MTLVAIAAVMACFLLWWRGRITATAGLAATAAAAPVAVLFFLVAAPLPAAN